jgi:hypothetical protein
MAKARHPHAPTSLTREQKEAAVVEFEDALKAKVPGAAKIIGAKLGVTATALYWWRKQVHQGWATGDPYKNARKLKRNGAGKPVVALTKIRGSVVAVASPRIFSATALLRQARKEFFASIRSGELKEENLSRDQLLSQLALTELERGDQNG